ncbi:MAG TPA: phosphoribosylformylglycinamidine cyclo-ligase [Stellaceae bacterium]|nr:phosphoribosylformylglycinamidine cyclo-ligase [Stellaceae bacterium]
MTAATSRPTGYKEAGVDIAEADAGLRNIVRRITATWPAGGPHAGVGAVQLPIGYFANVIDIGGGIGLALGTDGVGSKLIVAQMTGRWDTIGIDCVAMNVNDLVCVGARPLSMVDYIAAERVSAAILDQIAAGLAEGARQAGISIAGGEIAQLPDSVRGFDLCGAAVGLVPLDRILVGRDIVPGDRVIGIASNGIHSNGFSLVRRALFKQAGLSVDAVLPELGGELGAELLRPTHIYVAEALDLIARIGSLRALVHITGDGLLNLPRVAAEVGFVLDALPPPPPIFGLIERHAGIGRAEMFEVFNMGIGFCAIVGEAEAAAALALLAGHGREARLIGRAVADPTKSVRLSQYGLVGCGKRFRPE